MFIMTLILSAAVFAAGAYVEHKFGVVAKVLARFGKSEAPVVIVEEKTEV